MITYKLFTLRKSGTLGSLFINRRQVLPIGVWMEAENYPTKGYKERFGWHSTGSPVAPHLSKKGRVWAKVEIEDYEELRRPKSQGSKWFISKRMKIKEVV